MFPGPGLSSDDSTFESETSPDDSTFDSVSPCVSGFSCAVEPPCVSEFLFLLVLLAAMAFLARVWADTLYRLARRAACLRFDFRCLTIAVADLLCSVNDGPLEVTGGTDVTLTVHV